jgi:hypothetical protein
MSTNYEAPHCVNFSILTLLHPYYVQIFSSAPCSQTPSVYALPLMCETKFHTPTKLTTPLNKPQINVNIKQLWAYDVALTRKLFFSKKADKLKMFPKLQLGF